MIKDYKLKGYSFILNTDMVRPHWEIAKRKTNCRLCGQIIKKGSKRFVLEVDLDHPCLSTYYQIFLRFYFCDKHTTKEIKKALGLLGEGKEKTRSPKGENRG